MKTSTSKKLPGIKPQWRATLRDTAYYCGEKNVPFDPKKKPINGTNVRPLVKRGLVGRDADGKIWLSGPGQRLLFQFPPPSVGDVVKILVPPRMPWTVSNNVGIVVGVVGGTDLVPNRVDVWFPENVPVPATYVLHVDTLEIINNQYSVAAVGSMFAEYERWEKSLKVYSSPLGPVTLYPEAPASSPEGNVELYDDSPVDFSRFTFLDD